jgi:anti-anti-sigma factor
LQQVPAAHASPILNFARPGRALPPPDERTVQIATRHFADTIVATPVGRVDHRSAAELEATLAPLLSRCVERKCALVLDLSAVDYISSVGLRVLMISAKQMRAAEAKLFVAALQGVVAEIFAISRFDKILIVHPTLEAALGHCSAASLAAYQAEDGSPAS